MAMAKLLVLLVIALLAINIVMAESSMVTNKDLDEEVEPFRRDYHGHGRGVLQGNGPGSLKSYQCAPQCSRRCGRAQYKKPCLFFCNKCCAKCLCVPAGYYGNKASCPCYNNWKTKEGAPKCP